MINMFSNIKVLCALILMGLGLSVYSAAPTVSSVTAQQRYPRDGLVDITVMLQGAAEDVAKAECLFAATNGTTKAAIPVEHITRNGDDTGSGTVWTRKLIWDAKADVGTVKIDNVALTVGVRAALPGVQLWEDGPYWAECNVGATQPEESGYYFWWGDTVGYTRNANNDGWISVKDSSSFSFVSGNCPTYGKSVSELVSEGYLDSTGNLVAAHDAATAYLGAPWRMPTDAEFKALIGNCTTTWMTRNGVNGLLVSGKGAYASKSIFLPAAGYGCNSYLYNLGSFGLYWSTAPYSDGTNHAIYLYSSSSMVIQSGNSRSNGPTVRPLRGFVDEGELVDAVTTLLSLDCRSLAVTASQRYPWNGLVDITVTLQGTAEDVANAECLFAATNGTTKAAIPITRITRNGTDTYADGVWIRRFVWDASADVGAVKIDDVVLTVGVRAALPGVQLWENGPYWAECNVGATQPEESGYYFWWGDTVGYVHDGSKWVASDGSSVNFSFYNYNNENPVIATMRKDEAALKSEGWIGEDGELTAAHDAATAHLGTPWRMPTEAELSALISNCTTTWMTRNGVNGRLVTGKGAYSAKNIFLPAAGYGDESDLDDFCSYGLYWSSTPYSDYSLDTRYLAFDSDYFGRAHSFRYRGQPVRPVRESASNNAFVGVGETVHLSLDCRGAKVAGGTHPIVYDAAWYMDGVTAKIAANGQVIGSGSAGFCAWTPSSDGVQLLALNVYDVSGTVVGSETVFCLSREDLAELVIPEGTTEIGECAFAGGGFTSVTIPPSVTNIGAAAFAGCSGLKTATVSRWDYDLSVFPEGCQIVYLGGVDISNIEVFSGWPWREVVIGYTIVGSLDETMSLELSAKDNVSGKTYACKTLEGVDLTPGSHIIKWNASADGAKFKSDDVVFTARIVHKSPTPLYCVVDLSAGANATSYPVSYLEDVPTGGWTDEYKTTKLVLRRIEAGTFTMGSPSNEVGHEENEAMHSVELTKPFYMGVFEVTQKQYQLVMGDNPSAYSGDARPVENISFDMIRGTLEGQKWPLTNAVDATSFMGKIRARTGLTFDLPTEAQWEYACRAGTATALNIGKVLVNPKTQDPGMDGVGRYGFNNGFKGGTKDGKGGYGDFHTTVGSYLPNAWGLYDMHGNVQEWCLDWYKSALGTSKATDPTGPANQYGSRVLRGGSWSSYAQACRSAFRMMSYSSSFSDDFSGLRLCCGVDQEKNTVAEPFDTNGGTETMSVAVDTTFKDGTRVADRLAVAYGSVGASGCRVTANGMEIVNSAANGVMDWLPSAGGEYKLVYSCGGVTMESTVIKEELTVSVPVITPSDGSVFKTGTCTVTITCATDDVLIFYTKDGSVPKMKSEFLYRGPFEITNTATIVAVALGKNGIQSDYAKATISHVEPEPSALAVTALQCSPRNGLVDIIVTLQGTAEDVANAECLFAATNGTAKAAIPVEHITRNGDDTGSGTVWTRKFVWDARADVGTVKIDDVALTVGVRAALPGVQLWEDGPYWAECNVGATKPEECGYYFLWGDTVGYKRNANNDGWISVKDSTSFSFSSGDCPTYGKSKSELVSEGYLDSTGNLVAAHDAATTHLGAPWRMPTDAEFSALINNCTTIWTTRNGVYGRLITGTGAYSSKSIFLPAAGNGNGSSLGRLGSYGYYWSSTPYSGNSVYAWFLFFYSSNFKPFNSTRAYGQSVRPVRGFPHPDAAVGGVTTHMTLDCRPLVVPTVEGDDGATVTGDDEMGYVVKPSEGNTAVEVTIPLGVDAAKVTVEVLPITKTIATRGARVKIVSRGVDITEYLNVPAADGNGVVDLTKATVKEEYVKEAMDPKKGAVIDLCGGPLGTTGPTITTAPTRVGLFYQLREGETLDGMKGGDSKVGDGEVWTPNITVKGGNSAFYSIGVGKGE